MKKSLYAIAALALVLLGCSKKEFNETFAPGDVVTVRAQVNDTYTKVAADNAGTFSWQDGDKITILNDENAPFEFATVKGGTDAAFTSTSFSGGLGTIAYYPASASHTNTVFNLASEFAWVENASNMPMIGTVNTSEKKVSFKTAGAAIKLVCFNVPADARKLVVSSDSKNLSGAMTISSGSILTADGSNAVSITFAAGHPTNMVFYVPVPTGNLGKLTFVMKDGSDADVSTPQTTKQAITMDRQHIVAAPALNCSAYDLLLLETFDAPGDKTETVSAYNSAKAGQTVYSGATINYSIGSNANTIVYQNAYIQGETNQSNFAGGAEPGELFLAKKASSIDGVFIISGIPAKVSNSLKLTFKCNQNSTSYVNVTADTGITLSELSASATKPYTISYDITVSGSYAADTFSLTFTNGGSSNTRIDDILITTVQDSFTAPSISADKELLTIDKDGGNDSTDFTFENRVNNTDEVVAVVKTGGSWLTATITGSYPNYTLTVSAEKNTDAARVATVTLRASGVSKDITVTQSKSGSGPVIDALDRAFTGVSGTSYTAWSGKTSNSSAIYAGKTAGGNDAIQLRSTGSDCGIVTTASGGDLNKVVVVWNSNTASGRTIDIYGKASAYSSAADLYSTSTQGTKLGSIVNGTSTELTITGDYQFIGIRSNSGALYLDSISITWE